MTRLNVKRGHVPAHHREPMRAIAKLGFGTAYVHEHGGHEGEISPTVEGGIIHGNKLRFRIACRTCGKILHPATVAPLFVLEYHVQIELERAEEAAKIKANRLERLRAEEGKG